MTTKFHHHHLHSCIIFHSVLKLSTLNMGHLKDCTYSATYDAACSAVCVFSEGEKKDYKISVLEEQSCLVCRPTFSI